LADTVIDIVEPVLNELVNEEAEDKMDVDQEGDERSAKEM